MQDAAKDLQYLPTTMTGTWARAVVGTSYVPLSASEVTALLHDLVHQLDALLVSPTFTPEAGQAVGARLVDAHFTNPRSLSRTLAVLLAVPERLSHPSDQLTERWQGVVTAVAEGYTTALRDRVLREQQEMLEAALMAREQAENAMWATERRLEQTKEDFMATVSHELRTPLTPIKGYLHILLAQGDAISSGRRAEFYRVMLSQADQLQHLMDDLLTAASDVADAHLSVTPQPNDVAQIVKGALDRIDPPTARLFQWLGDDDVGAAICDPERLRQVLGNVLRNADMYSFAGEPVHVSARRRAGAVEIVVRDFGPGIPAELAEAVFEPFHRLGRGPTHGTGLGLHLSRRLIESMNGRIWQTDGRPGSSFHVTVPCAQE